MKINRIQLELPELNFGYTDLEPYISADILELHHKKHHQSYITNLKQALDILEDRNAGIEKILQAQEAISFNGGGHVNHTILWQTLAPKGKGGGVSPKDGPFLTAVINQFGSIGKLIDNMTYAALHLKGSGWVWLTYNSLSNCITIREFENQKSPCMFHLTALVGIDMWEHSYYLQYKNTKADYLNAIWNIINWDSVEKRYNEAIKNRL